MFTFDFTLNAIALLICIYQVAKSFRFLLSGKCKELKQHNLESYQNIKKECLGLNDSLVSFSVYLSNMIIVIETVIPIVLVAYAVNYIANWIAACIIFIITAIVLTVSTEDLMSYIEKEEYELKKKPIVCSMIEFGSESIFFLINMVILCFKVSEMIA